MEALLQSLGSSRRLQWKGTAQSTPKAPIESTNVSSARRYYKPSPERRSDTRNLRQRLTTHAPRSALAFFTDNNASYGFITPATLSRFLILATGCQNSCLTTASQRDDALPLWAKDISAARNNAEIQARTSRPLRSWYAIFSILAHHSVLPRRSGVTFGAFEATRQGNN